MKNIYKKARLAENKVADTLKAQDWLIIATNYRHIGFEIDIIAQKGQTLAFVEVKWRKWPLTTETDLKHLLPPRKQEALIRGACYFLSQLPEYQRCNLRFDLAVVSASPFNLHYIANVIEADT